MSELRAFLEFVANHRVPWTVALLLALYMILRKFSPWLAARFTLVDRETMDLVSQVFKENGKLRRELSEARSTLEKVREELVASKAVPEPRQKKAGGSS